MLLPDVAIKRSFESYLLMERGLMPEIDLDVPRLCVELLEGI